MVKDGSDVRLEGVSYSDATNQWFSPPVHFSGLFGSYGRFTNSGDVAVAGSFGWIAAVYREESGDGPLFEWNGLNDAHIWILQDKFYINVERVGCANERLQEPTYFNASVNNHQWYTMALSYDLDVDAISMWVDGQLVHKRMSLCARNLQTSTFAYINQW